MGQPTPNKADDRPILEVSSGGLVLVEKVNEHLDAIRMAHESRLAAQMEIPKKLQEYPNPLEEKVNLAVHMQMIRETQAILEGRPKPLTRGPVFLKPSLETIPEVTSSAERGSDAVVPSVLAKSQQQEEKTLDHEHNEKQPLNATDFGDEIPELEETMAREMWDAVQQRIDEESPSLKSPPFSIVDFTGRQSIEVDAMPYNEDEGSEESFPSKQTLRTMPSYIGEYEARSVVVKVPSIWKSLKHERDTANLHALMSTPVTCTLPLTDLLKIRPNMWESVAKCLMDQGLWIQRP